MRLIVKLLIISILLVIGFFVGAESTQAIELDLEPGSIDENTPTTTFTISGLTNGETYSICLHKECVNLGYETETIKLTAGEDGPANAVSAVVCGAEEDSLKTGCDASTTGDFFHASTYNISLYSEDEETFYRGWSFNVSHWFPTVDWSGLNGLDPDTAPKVKITGLRRAYDEGYRNDYDITIKGTKGTTDPETTKESVTVHEEPGWAELVWDDPLLTGNYVITLIDKDSDFKYFTVEFTVAIDGGEAEDPVEDPEGSDPGDGEALDQTFGDPNKSDPVETGFGGSIAPTAQGVAQAALNLGIGIAGGIAFLMMIFGAYRLIFAAGNPESIQQGREVITAAIIGLIIVIFATFILSFMGFTIFGGLSLW